MLCKDSCMAKRRHRRRYTGPPLTDHLTIGPGDVLGLRLGEFDARGETSSEVDGAPATVEGGIPGELVRAEVVKVFPERVVLQVVDVIEPSSDRVEPPCPYYSNCSGCQWQHVSYRRQLEDKARRVEVALAANENLRRAEVHPTLPSPSHYGYRNHARFTVGKRDGDAGKAGFVNATTRRFLQVDRCLLMDEPINGMLERMQGRLHGKSQVTVRSGGDTGSMLIQPAFNPPWPDLETGQSHYEETVASAKFRVASSSFFQVNTAQLANTIELMTRSLGLSGKEMVVDAYCGVGTFTVLLAPVSGRVTGIEESASAVADARINAAGLDNVEFIEDKTENALRNLNDPVDVLILDPPRRGCAPEAVAAATDLAPARIAMVSCEPDNMARDLAALCESAYTLDDVYPIDMFPQTRHVETLAILSRVDANGEGPERHDVAASD